VEKLLSLNQEKEASDLILENGCDDLTYLFEKYA
jgi:hypothetical protein